jgi:hypothetical protein
MAKAKKVRSVTIHNAENGWEAQAEHEPDEDDKGAMTSMYQPPAKHVFGHHEHAKMLAHVAEQLPPPKGVKQAEGPQSGESYADFMARRAKEARKGK